ncbi:MAG TPA: cation-translocating P-type ATPase [Verrucomicrobiae bacterium]|nr:cation-translocating P-type ATPase [Verrucomicrobiae bacterium]
MAVETITKSPAASSGRKVTELSVTGMDCSNCARHVTEAIQSVPGVHSAMVQLENKRASVRWNGGAAQDPNALIQAVSNAGYGAAVISSEPKAEHDSSEHRLAGWEFTLWVGILGTAPLMIGEWVFQLAMMPWFQWTGFVLATIVQVFAGAQFYRGAWNQLKIGRSNMDTLVALGSTTAFAYSTWALFSGHGGHVYFMESASIITLISLGHWMESRVSVRASGALRKLLNLAPQTARLRAKDGKETEVAVSDLEIGNVVALRPGDRIPTDGEVIEGDSAVDEAMLTGESVPVDKTSGKLLYAGTVNLNGRLLMRVTATGEETALAHIIAAVQRAQTSRANIQRLGDRISSVFVPIVVSIALAAALWWGFAPESAEQVHAWLAPFLWPAHPPIGNLAAAFIIAAAVLIIACPCAMGLATPTAIMAGSNAAAARGILIRDGVALEKAGEVTAVIFDKTGTLTIGKPEVVKVWERQPDSSATSDFAPVTKWKIGDLAAALARHSTHPLSQAIAKSADVEIPLTDWQEIRGAGVQAKLLSDGDSHSLKLGSLKWLRESGVNLSAGDAFIQEWSAHGATVVGLAAARPTLSHREERTGTELERGVSDLLNASSPAASLEREGENSTLQVQSKGIANDYLVGLFAVKDTVKNGSANVVAELNERGFKTYLLTGDNALTAGSIAQQAGIKRENVFAEVRPEQKAEFVKKLQQQGERVAFVGDGINDAPALEQADLGIAVSRASDVAREAADIILLKSEIEAVPEALGLAKATLRTIKQNLFWAFFYNAVGIPLAALGFMSPILCAAAMGFSDMIVIGNALRLRRWKLR